MIKTKGGGRRRQRMKVEIYAMMREERKVNKIKVDGRNSMTN